MPVSTFDFDELDAIEEAVGSCPGGGAGGLAKPGVDAAVGGCPGGGAGGLAEPGVAGEDAVALPAAEVHGPDESVRDLLVVGSDEGAVRAPPRSTKRMSKARAWFEIKRFFDAEPQRHYNSPDSREWQAYYAKELLLKSACEKLHSDGFVVIDALLSPHYFQQLARQLLLEAPEQAAALRDHVPGGRPGGAAALGWVGERQQARRGEQLRAQADAADAARAALVPSALPAAGESEHDTALCESCLLSLAHDRGVSSALRPQTKQQFFRFMKTYLQVVAENSMSLAKARPEEKIPVQFCFGNMPRPRAALTAPPAPLSLAGPARQEALEVD